MHGRTQHIGDDQAEKLRDGGSLGFEGVDGRENRRERGQADAQEDRPEREHHEVRVILG